MQTRVREEMWMRPPAHGGTGIMCQASTFCGTGGRQWEGGGLQGGCPGGPLQAPRRTEAKRNHRKKEKGPDFDAN
ncbi:unnamed protein product [Arctogadus glacialis]